MTTLVTGGSGYLGEVLVSELRARGDEVRIFDRVAPDASVPGTSFVRGDIRDRESVRRALSGCSLVHHAVAQVPLAKNADEFRTVNLDGTRILLEEAERARVRKVVLVSSSAIYGVPSSNPVTPSTAPAPREAYGRAKLAAERLGLDFVARGMDVSIIRPRTVLGHGRLGIFQLLFEWVRRGRPIYLLGRGNHLFQFVHATDLARACLLADARSGPATFLVGAERFGSMRELLTSLVEHAGSASKVRALPLRAAELAMNVTSRLGLSPLGDYHALLYGREMYFDVSETKSLLGWSARYSNAEMIRESYDHYLSRRAEVLTRRHASHHRSPVGPKILRVLDFLP